MKKCKQIKSILLIILLGCLALWLIFMFSQKKLSVPAQRMGDSMNYQVTSTSIAHLGERFVLAQDNRLILYSKDLNEGKCIRKSLLFTYYDIALTEDSVLFRKDAHGSFVGGIYEQPLDSPFSRQIIKGYVDDYLVVGNDIYYSMYTAPDATQEGAQPGLYIYNRTTKKTRQLLEGEIRSFDLYNNAVYFCDRAGNVFVQSIEEGSTKEHLFSVDGDILAINAYASPIIFLTYETDTPTRKFVAYDLLTNQVEEICEGFVQFRILGESVYYDVDSSIWVYDLQKKTSRICFSFEPNTMIFDVLFCPNVIVTNAQDSERNFRYSFYKYDGEIITKK